MVAYQDTSMIVFNFLEEFYLVYYKKTRHKPIFVEKEETN